MHRAVSVISKLFKCFIISDELLFDFLTVLSYRNNYLYWNISCLTAWMGERPNNHLADSLFPLSSPTFHTTTTKLHSRRQETKFIAGLKSCSGQRHRERISRGPWIGPMKKWMALIIILNATSRPTQRNSHRHLWNPYTHTCTNEYANKHILWRIICLHSRDGLGWIFLARGKIYVHVKNSHRDHDQSPFSCDTIYPHTHIYTSHPHTYRVCDAHMWCLSLRSAQRISKRKTVPLCAASVWSSRAV